MKILRSWILCMMAAEVFLLRSEQLRASYAPLSCFPLGAAGGGRRESHFGDATSIRHPPTQMHLGERGR